jgi:error-prone DNA polymerase
LITPDNDASRGCRGEAFADKRVDNRKASVQMLRPYTHLHVHSNFSFLDGGSGVRALLDRAKEVGCKSLAITDHNGLYGAVRFYDYAKKAGIKPIVGVELDLDGANTRHSECNEESAFRATKADSSHTLGMTSNHHIVLLAKNLNGYSNLCKIITRAQLSHEKGEATADMEVIKQYSDDLFCLSGCPMGEIPSLLLLGRLDEARVAAQQWIDVFGRDNFLIEMQNNMLPGAALLNSQLYELASELGLRIVATNNVHYAAKEDFKVQDVLACVQTTTTLDDDHPLRKRNSEYYLKTPKAMANLFRRYPQALANTEWVADQCNLDLNLGTFRFPDFPLPKGETAYSHLCKLCFEALERLYRPITPDVVQRLQYELKVINDLGFPEYFLAVWDIVRYARSKGIRCSGRGSAADSLVAYCLGITIADPIEHNLLFERFLNPERKGMPDIDIDFDAARRDEVIEYIYNRYGEDKVAMVCTVSCLKARSSIRDLGKAMGFPPDDIARLASALPHVGGKRIREAMDKLPELRNSNLPITRLEALIDVCEKVDDFPRHLSVHLGGVVISKDLLTELVPLEWATKGVIVSQFDKDDIETLGLVKMDILGLRNLSAIEDALPLIKLHHGIDLDIDNIALDDEPTYEMLRSCDTVGCFQVESPGMRGLLGRLQPRVFDDVIAQISLFRPGPMQADMINPFIARRHGEEEIVYLHPSLEPVLKETYGVILYQEQVISVSHALAGFTYGQSDSLRRAMTTDRSQEEMEKIREAFVAGAHARGVEPEVAEEVFSKLRAFAAYGFCKAHAASFAKIAFQTAYLKTHYPAEFLTGILNNEPMGFYPPNVIVEEARRLGIGLLGVDVNKSDARFTVEAADLLFPIDDLLFADQPASVDRIGNSKSQIANSIRVGLNQVKNISEAEVKSIVDARSERPFSSFSDFCLRTRCDRPTVENLINCGAFDSFNIPRGKLLWLLGEIITTRKSNLKSKISNLKSPRLLDGLSADDLDEQMRQLPDGPQLSLHERVRMDYEILGLSTICHPMVFYREKLTRARMRTAREIRELPDNTMVKVAGVVVVCMRPPTKSGAIVVFITLEDETGFADCVVFPKVYEQCGSVIFNNPALIIEGKAQKMGKGFSIIASKVRPLTSTYRTDNAVELKPFKERIRIAGQRSFVRSAGV